MAKLLSPLNPLKLTFSDQFFADLPEAPGVYRMYDRDGSLLYIGKAKDLKARLKSYRTTSPIDLPRKVARMIQQVLKIEFEVLATEKDALILENQLLRSQKPPFNRLNTHPEAYSLLGIRNGFREIEFEVLASYRFEPKPNWIYFGAFKRRRLILQALQSMRRLIEWKQNPTRDFSLSSLRELSSPRFVVKVEADGSTLLNQILRFLKGSSRTWLNRLSTSIEVADGFQRHVLSKDIEILNEFYEACPHRNSRLKRHFKLPSHFIHSSQLDDLLVREKFE